MLGVGLPSFALQMQGQLSHVVSAVSGADTASYSFASLNIGAADDHRFVVVHVAAHGVGGGGSSASIPSAVTIGGVTATPLTSRGSNAPGAPFGSSFWGARIPAGTTATVDVTFGVSQRRCGVSTFRLINETLTPRATGGAEASGTTDLTDTVSVAEAGIYGVASYDTGGSPFSFTWSGTGVSEVVDQAVESSAQMSAALLASGASPVTASSGNNNGLIGAWVAW